MIKGIYFLSQKDFNIKESVEGKLLSLENGNKGVNLVLFYSNECKYCDEVISEFKKLPNHIFGCVFSIINVNQNKEVVSLSKETLSPITYVPELILFIDNLPYLKYEGKVEIEEIQNFLREVSATLEKNSFMKTSSPTKPILDDEKENPTQSNFLEILDQPFSKKSKKVCYLEDDKIICT